MRDRLARTALRDADAAEHVAPAVQAHGDADRPGQVGLHALVEQPDLAARHAPGSPPAPGSKTASTPSPARSLLVATDPVVAKGEMVPEFHALYGSAALMLVNEAHGRVTKNRP